MAHGEGKGRWAATEAARNALANPLFDAPLHGASGVLFNISGGKDLTLGQVHEVAEIIRKAAKSDANVIFGVVQDPRLKRRVSITLVGTGIRPSRDAIPARSESESKISLTDADFAELLANKSAGAMASIADSRLI